MGWRQIMRAGRTHFHSHTSTHIGRQLMYHHTISSAYIHVRCVLCGQETEKETLEKPCFCSHLSTPPSPNRNIKPPSEKVILPAPAGPRSTDVLERRDRSSFFWVSWLLSFSLSVVWMTRHLSQSSAFLGCGSNNDRQ